ncbi:dicarboxylate/amino acid:cation symporter [bacterium (Candidatus Blackallbacteria) CG17_big_fil_post_rev_8_21_14_2_50_48_46]|uniref:Dicarboxylate/amino acid:cation symporter n=1 Tax=bacterium (Candidatus Blackallbacteria) CG17_big_fil_post_rev_8_21_14_2_50_48_46 TaxID=2014261 RepID=A0A2M7G831_9BACT|nr:MAG: dicarboxylate/amino acid:cation symporter [bacterium (Candidatus Blackallbacteria) CG18_big_fil_WC_8_21_14_2_50_49_26]PIW18243.1 MAG: dicarboxylate/amino acid:cation symporter [bacterium (Candidatus Blackallbacteria) CG17_big_fil_post_rev_8_21_14_2_50_48_46]PIW50674.1 MAG: dicarboxylate/amino acid:cation symporter [bacterium (Candidatus Blackallbacteria) CG13_big_fil_rev_8_21_14_2_50_49_14]
MKSIPLHTRIFIGMLVGILAGALVQFMGLSPDTVALLVAWIKPVGDLFLRMIFMLVIPLLLSALILGVAELGNLQKIGRIGLKTLVYSLVASAISVVVGLSLFNLIHPAQGIKASDRQFLLQKFASTAAGIQEKAQAIPERSLTETLVSLVPKNPVEDMARAFDPSYSGGGLLAVMFFAVILGLALSASEPAKVQPVKDFLEGVYEMVMKGIGFGMGLAPFGVASLLFVLVSNLGLGILQLLLQYVGVVLLALVIQQFGVYSLILKMAGYSPLKFFKGIREVMLTAFSTSSSNATLPTALRVTQEELMMPPDISRFVLTVGSTGNQNGTALFEGITILFLAECFGVHLSLMQQILVVMLSILAGVGTAGVPGGSLPLIVSILISLGVPGESIAMIYGVDRLLDMSRTVLNVTGDITAVVVVSRLEGRLPSSEAPFQT